MAICLFMRTQPATPTANPPLHSNTISFKLSYAFLIAFLLILLIPIPHRVHCSPYLFPDQCATEKLSLGFYFASHIAGFFYDLLTLSLTFSFSEMAGVLIIFFILFFVGNLVVNRFILLFATACYPFFGKSFTIHVRTGIKYWLFNLLLVFVIILLSFLAVEGVLRLVSGPLLPNDLSSAKINHPSTGWVNKPQFQGMIQGENGYPIHIQHNSLGLRSRSEVAPKTKTKKRILLLGDSFVYGAGLEENETLSFFLQEELGDQFEVLNGGVSAFSTLQASLLFDNLSAVLSPDLVVLGIYNNDIKENVFLESSGQAKPVYTHNIFNGIAKNSADSQAKRGGILNNRHWFIIRFNTLIFPLTTFLSSKSLFFKKLEQYERGFLRMKDESYEHPDFLFTNRQDQITNLLYGIGCKALDDFAKNLANKKIAYLFFYIPHRFEIEPELAPATFKQYYDISPEQIDLDRPLRELSACATKRNLTFFSLKESFLTQKEGGKLYNRHGHHWSPKATQLTAKQLAEKIRAQK